MVFEASGTPAALDGAIGAVRRGGTVVLLGNLPGGSFPAPLNPVMAKELDLVGSFRFDREFAEAVGLIAEGKVDVLSIVTARRPLAEVNDAFALALDRSQSVKVVLTAAMTADWIAVDWGSSNLRAWAMDGGTVTAEGAAATGAVALEPDAFEPALLAVISPWLPDARTDVIVCGMAGARGGWAEAPYATVPCPPGPASFARPPTRDPRLAVRILPGLRQDAPADVMRGEETQIAGLLAAEPGFEGVACLPGTHTKWVHLSAGEVVSFASYMTGEIFALLATASVLRKTVAPDGWSEPDFLQAVEDGMARPERAASRLFGLRAEALLHGLAPERARARLSGLLIGAELAGSPPLLARPRGRADRRRPPGRRPTAPPSPRPASPPASSTPPP